MNTQYFYSFIISFIGGVAFESVAKVGISFAILLTVISIIIFFSQRHIFAIQKSFLVSLILFGCALGIMRVDVLIMRQNIHPLGFLLSNITHIRGLVVEEPDVRENYINIVLEAQDVLYDNSWKTLKKTSLILVRISPYDSFSYGDKVELIGKLRVPENFKNDDGSPSFDYRAYLAKDDIYYQMYFPKTSLIEHHRGNVLYEKLFTLKNFLMINITRAIPEPEAALAGGILLGVKQSLGAELLQKFRETGVSHIIVLSGYNIAIVASVVARMISFMPTIVQIIISIISVFLFALMVGGGATVVRATIMVLVVILARATGREHNSLRALCVAGIIMVAVNPSLLLHDMSFQLSFMATLAIITLVPVVDKYFLWVKNATLREILVSTVSTQLFVLPLILYQMGSISLVGVITNIFILPVIPLAMFMVSLVATFSWIPLIGPAIAFLSYILLAYIIAVILLFAKIPFAYLSGMPFPLWLLVPSYVFLFFIIKRSSHLNSNKKV
ncbi:MAG: ComEC family competence protein [Candidatus Yonathbacteria bacterium]|nr:ComEC family competence protein [Candidatus Yonathbacteria bacterium]